MIIRRFLPVFAFLASTIAHPNSLAAQPHADGWIFCGLPLMGPGVAVGRIDPAWQRTTIVRAGVLSGDAQGGTLDVDNRDLIIAHSRNLLVQYSGGVHRVSRSGSVVQTILDDRTHEGIFNDVALTPNGGFVVACGPFGAKTPGHVLLVSRGGMRTTIYRGGMNAGPLAIAIDQHTGNYTVLEGPLPQTRLLSVRLNGSATTIAVLPRGGTQIAQDQATGDWFVGASTGVAPGAVVLRVTRQGNVTTVLASGFVDAAALCIDRASSSRPRLLFGTGPLGSGVHAFDLSTRAVTTLLPVPIYGHSHLFPDQSVNLAPVSRGPGRWDLLVNFPSEPGNAYVLGLSLSGVRPGLKLADGRRLLLNVDALTALGLQGRLGAIFTGATGLLNAVGRAVATLDVRRLRGLTGTRVWCLALTLDARAPTGVRTIADPRIVVL